MATEWFIEKNGKWHGPFSSARLKALASEGKLQASDHVRKGQEGKAIAARQIKGLFDTVVEPDGSASGLEGNGAESSEAAGVWGRAKASAKNLAVLAKKQAKLQKLKLVDLPAAYQAIGAKALAQNVGRDQFASTYADISELDAQVVDLRKAEEPSSNATVTDRVKQAGRAAAKLASIEKLLAKRKTLVSTLGSQIQADTNADYAELQLELEHARGVEESIEQLKSELNALGSKRSLFGTTRVAAAIVVVFLLLVVGGWLKSRFFPSNAANEQIAKTNKLVAETFANINAEQAEIKKKSEAIKLRLENERLEAKKRQELEAAQRELVIQQARLEKERTSREMEEKRAKEETMREAESTVQQEEEQKNRKEFAERYFGGISFDPAESITLSDSLKNAGVSVELRGVAYKSVQRLQEQKDWLGLINFMLEKQGRPPYDSYPAVDVIRNAFTQDYELFVLIRTQQQFSLGKVQFPLSRDRSFSYQNELVSNSTRFYSFEPHPDGIGYLTRWHPTQGSTLIYVQRRGDDAYIRSREDRLSEFREQMEQKLRLGELDRKTLEVRYIAEMGKLQDEVEKFLNGH